jgi:hypothetical protein
MSPTGLGFVADGRTRFIVMLPNSDDDEREQYSVEDANYGKLETGHLVIEL